MIEQQNIDNIITWLAAVGYTYNAATDGAILTLLWDDVINEVFHGCNISSVSPCDYAEIERVTAFRLLQIKLKVGTLTGVAIDAIVKKVTEGDTTVEYAVGNTSASDNLAKYFAENSVISKSLIARHRKLVW